MPITGAPSAHAWIGKEGEDPIKGWGPFKADHPVPGLLVVAGGGPPGGLKEAVELFQLNRFVSENAGAPPLGNQRVYRIIELRIFSRQKALLALG